MWEFELTSWRSLATPKAEGVHWRLKLSTGNGRKRIEMGNQEGLCSSSASLELKRIQFIVHGVYGLQGNTLPNQQEHYINQSQRVFYHQQREKNITQ